MTFDSAGYWPDIDVEPSLQLDDVSGIPFLSDIAGVEEYQHRARLRARAGDLFAAVTPAREEVATETPFLNFPPAEIQDQCLVLNQDSTFRS